MSKDFTATLVADRTPKEVFDAVNNVRGWWNADLKGSSHQVNDEFEVRFDDIHYSKQKVAEIQAEKRVVWLVTESSLNFLKDKEEWTGTTISFDISGKGNKTHLEFKHEGLVPEIECYDACSNAWYEYLESLKLLIMTGKGRPHRNTDRIKESQQLHQ